MNRRLAILLIAAFAAGCASGHKLATTEAGGIDWGWTEICPGAEVGRASVNLFGALQDISVVRYRLSMFDTRVANDTGADADSTSVIIIKHGGIAGINASYFNIKTLTPVTFVKEDGACEGRTTPEESGGRTDGLLHIRRAHRIIIEPCDTLCYDEVCEGSDDAIAAGPVLLIDGRPARESWPDEPFYTSRHPRTLYGTTAHKWGYMIVIDGRSCFAAGVSIPEAAQIALMLGLEDAINMDGGGSSTIWTEKTGVLNHPSDNHRFDHFGQRIVPNVIYIRDKAKNAIDACPRHF